MKLYAVRKEGKYAYFGCPCLPLHNCYMIGLGPDSLVEDKAEVLTFIRENGGELMEFNLNLVKQKEGAL